jgi:hypothetical protein
MLEVGDAVSVRAVRRPLGSEPCGTVEAVNRERVRIRWNDGAVGDHPAESVSPVGIWRDRVANLARRMRG